MEIRQFTYVNMVAECGSMTKAAAKLFITQPALSNYISKLEEELGTKLFDRSVTPMKLTFSGEKYLEHARTVMMQIDNMEREIRDITNHQTGRRVWAFQTSVLSTCSRRCFLCFTKNIRGFVLKLIMPLVYVCWIFWQPVMWILYFYLAGRSAKGSSVILFPMKS